jgi:hypothetical protein
MWIVSKGTPRRSWPAVTFDQRVVELLLDTGEFELLDENEAAELLGNGEQTA